MTADKKHPTGNPAGEGDFRLEAETLSGAERTLVYRPDGWHRPREADATTPYRTPEAQLQEAVNLAEAIRLEVVEAAIIKLRALNPSTFIGTGKMQEIKARVEAEDIDVVILDCALSPIQQRNLERGLKTKVIDRTGLILEIFGDRAETREGVVQVALAHLTYQKGRLVRSWTHLERQRGGVGFMGGPGERQIESDRRQIQDHINNLKARLKKIRATRELHRKDRRAAPYPVVALVGYTNAGKSTLFNRLTGAEVMVKDMLFATLDPTMRAIKLVGNETVILSDTVGFVSDLPTELVEAFRATLEEVQEADIILHVRDMASETSEAEKQDVLSVLHDLGIDERETPVIEVWNKLDLLPPEDAHALRTSDRGISISALTGEGMDALRTKVLSLLQKQDSDYRVMLPETEGRALAWLYGNGRVQSVGHEDANLIVYVALPAAKVGQFEANFFYKLDRC